MIFPNECELLRHLQESLTYVVQQKDRRTGEWSTVEGSVRGRTAAFGQLHIRKRINKRAILRVISKNEADKYREGIAVGRRLGPAAPKVLPGPRLTFRPTTQPHHPTEGQPVPARQGHNPEDEK